jgi:hypothetical protein
MDSGQLSFNCRHEIMAHEGYHEITPDASPVRKIESVYEDPLSVIWLDLTRQLGIAVHRDDEVFAAWDGNGTLTIGKDETLDPDDSLAQMIFHELCHALTEGESALSLPDWGLENDRPDHVIREHACLHLQAALAGKYGLREFFATTTDFREYYDRLPADPLADQSDAATRIASEAWTRATEGPWSKPLAEALERTSEIATIIKTVAGQKSLWNKTQASPLSDTQP